MAQIAQKAGKRIIKENGSKRVSAGAANQLISVLEKFATRVSKESIEVAKTEDRVTVTRSDIREVLHN